MVQPHDASNMPTPVLSPPSRERQDERNSQCCFHPNATTSKRPKASWYALRSALFSGQGSSSYLGAASTLEFVININ